MSDSAILYSIRSNPTFVPVVLPPSADLTLSGRIRNLAIRGVPSADWLEPVEGGGWTLKKSYELKGYVLLEDLYRDEHNDEGWESYKRYLRDWQAGRTGSSFPFHLLPKEVQDRQKGLLPEDKMDPWAPAKMKTTGVTVDVTEGSPKKGK